VDLPAAGRAAGRRQPFRFDFIVWGADEIRRFLVRHSQARHPAHQGSLLHPHH
jgi:hypothetical protein